MNASTNPIHPDSSAPTAWGYSHPECRGAQALLFFISDLARVVNETLTDRALDDASMREAQDAVDVLTQRYIAIEAAPAAFRGQRILLKLEPAQGGRGPQVALQMSPELEDQIIEAQRLAQHQSAVRQ